MSESNEYVLGTAAGELRRLESQHPTWTRQAYALWERAGFSTGDRLAELDAFRADWRALSEERTGWIHTPVMVDLILRRPGG